MKNQEVQCISKATFNRAVLAACLTVGKEPPKWFREHTANKVRAALLSLNIKCKT